MKKLCAFVLALLMVFSLMPTAFAATTAGNPDITEAAIESDLLNAKLTADDIIIEQRGEKIWIYVFLPHQTVVALNEQFITDCTAINNSATSNLVFSSYSGHTELAKHVVAQLLKTRLVRKTSTGYTYNSAITRVSTTLSYGMLVSELIQYYTEVPVEAYVIGGVDISTTDKFFSSWMEVYTYEEVPTSQIPQDRYPIWAVRELNRNWIEVYLENGMIVTLEKAAIVDWVNSRSSLGGSFRLSCSSSEVDRYGRAICSDFFRDLLDSLIHQGYTVYPESVLESSYTYSVSARDVMQDSRLQDTVLPYELERARSGDKSAEFDITFEWYERGKLQQETQYPISIEFLRHSDTWPRYEFAQLLNQSAFTYHFYKTDEVQINSYLVDLVVKELMGP